MVIQVSYFNADTFELLDLVDGTELTVEIRNIQLLDGLDALNR